VTTLLLILVLFLAAAIAALHRVDSTVFVIVRVARHDPIIVRDTKNIV